jgi:hypothetical protein
MSKDETRMLKRVARIYGAKSVSEFLRDLIGGMCSGDAERLVRFQSRMAERMQKQMVLQLHGEAMAEAQKLQQVPRGGRRARAT